MATVYLSSTISDLHEHRDIVITVIQQLGHTVITRGEFHTNHYEAVEQSRLFLSFCDLYIGLFAWRYGEIPEQPYPERLSFPVLEYRQAGQFGLTRLVFLLDKDAPWPATARDSVTGAGDGGRRIAELRHEFEHEPTTRLFSTADELATLVRTAVLHWEQEQSPFSTDCEGDRNDDPLVNNNTDDPIVESEPGNTTCGITSTFRIFAPLLPFPYIERPDELVQLRSALLIYDHTHYRVPVALVGGGGSGKSVLATALCYDKHIQSAFPDGVFWIPIGKKPENLLQQLIALGGAFGDSAVHYKTLETARTRLAALLRQRAVLLVLDDVWSPQQVELFHIDAPGCRLLFTTRDAHIALFFAAQTVKIGPLSTPQAEALLHEWTLRDDPALGAIAKRLGNLPLALKFVGMRLREGYSGTEWLATFQHLSQLNPGRSVQTTSDNLALCFTQSLLPLTEEDRLLYYALGIFPGGSPIPDTTITRLWQQLQPNVSHADCEDLLTELARRFLLERNLIERTVTVREPLATYIRDQLGDAYGAVTMTLLRAYNPHKQSWATIQDDGYLYHHLTYHLHQAQQIEQLRQLLLDINWLQAKLLATDLTELFTDFTIMSEDPEIRLILDTLHLSVHILKKDKTQLRSQLYGRLLSYEPLKLDTVREQAKHARQQWLRPLTASLAGPGGPLIRTLSGHIYATTAVAVTPNGRFAISASADHTIKIWNLQDGQELCTLVGHTDTVTAVAVTPDGQKVVSASTDHTIKVWNLDGGHELRTLVGHTHAVIAIAITPDGQHVLSASGDETLKMWNIHTGEDPYTFTGHDTFVTAVAIPSHARQFVSASEDGTLTIWGMRSHLELFRLTGHASIVTTVAITPNGNIAVSASGDNTLKVWDLENGTEIQTLAGHTAAVTAVAITPEGRSVVSGSSDCTIKVWDLATGKEQQSFIGHTNWITAVTVTPNGQFVISASTDRTLKVWNLHGSQKRTAPLAHRASITAVAFTPSGRSVISASSDRTLAVWERESGKKRRSLRGHTDSVIAVAVTRDGRQVISGSADHTLKVWDLLSGLDLHSLHGHTNWVTTIVTTADGQHIVSGSGDGTVRVWDLNSGTLLRSLVGHTNWVTAVAVTPNSHLIISASTDRQLKVWDLKSGKELRSLTGHLGPVMACSVTPDGQRIISASSDRTLKIWDLHSGTQISTLSGHTDVVRTVTVTPDGRYIISGADDETVRAWDLSSSDLIASINIDAPVRTCRVAPNGSGRTIVAGDQLGYLHFLRLEAQESFEFTVKTYTRTSKMGPFGTNQGSGQKPKPLNQKAKFIERLVGAHGNGVHGTRKKRTIL